MHTELMLGFYTLLTSALAGMMGLGGGTLLIAIMPIYLPGSAIVPIHGLVQLASNSSRMLFSLKAVAWELVSKFIAGSLVGIALIGFLLVNISTSYIPVFIAVYILLNLWVPPFSSLIRKYENFYIVGLVQGGLGLLIGATGPLAVPLLAKELNGDKDRIVATNAFFMGFSHFAKLIVFGLIGFSFTGYGWLLVYMVVGAVVGSWLGTVLRGKINGELFGKLLNYILTALAFNMLYQVFF
ncbi:MAG: sulfite exporter TauE/SafE family protein [Pseudomonadales bacterium]